MILDKAEALLDPVSDIEGFMLACLVDASTGMVLASRKDQDDIGLPTAAAGVADITNVLFQLTGELPVDGLEDVMVTFRRQLYVIRLVNPEPQILLLVTRLVTGAQIRPPRRVNTQVNELRAFRASKGVTSRVLLLVILDRDRVNLAMARREIRTFCASFAV